MKKYFLIVIAIGICAVTTKADYATIYSSVSYNSSTDTVTAYSYTYPNYVSAMWYDTYLSSGVYDSSFNHITGDYDVQPSGGMAEGIMSGPGNGCDWYTIQTGHWLQMVYYVQDWYASNPYPGYHTGYYDPYNFQIEGGQPTPPDYWYELQGPGPEYVRQSFQTDIFFTEALSDGACNAPARVTITKADGGNLETPHRLGINGGGHDRKQNLKAVVVPKSKTNTVDIESNSRITISNIAKNAGSGTITFSAVGSQASQTAGDSYIRANEMGTPLAGSKSVSVVIPSKIATPHDTSGTYSASNRALDGSTSPGVVGLARGEVLLCTVYVRYLSIVVHDQFGASIGDVYLGAKVAEILQGQTVDNGITLSASSSYLDPVGTCRHNNDIVDAGSTAATTWWSQPMLPMVNNSATQNIPVLVDGFTLNPSIVNRTWTTTPPSTLSITWPN